ncbi:MAG: ABC transporter ATP-binding protein [Thermodesulfovibrionales bacterium]
MGNTESVEEVLRASELSKIYKLYSKSTDRLKEYFFKGNRHTDFVALDRVSFSIRKGETLGIVGENGAGKSTLLQLIAGTLSPTSGEVMVNGRVLALLELGIGFHPDFTGRENIFFYGDMLGLPRRYVQSKFNDIMEFSELGYFMDRPLKTYSTGMQMRLAFSLVSSLEPDILIIDEALSVGDIYFQKKCIDRIMDFKNNGKTIIFCSHSTYHVNVLCNKTIWLKDGAIEMSGEPEKVLPAYEHYQLQKEGKIHEYDREAHAPVLIRELKLLNAQPLKRGDDLQLSALLESKGEENRYHFSISLKIDPSWGVYFTGSHIVGKEPLKGKRKRIIVTFPKMQILGGYYYIHARVLDENGFVVLHEKILPPFEVKKDSLERGVCHFENHWEFQDV